MTSNQWMFRRVFTAQVRAILLVLFFSGLAPLSVTPSLADGFFVFKWNKKIDINEPTQKAVILYDVGREDLLLQVKYEGPLREFGWLVPVPSVPKVERGSMDAFYELSELTQRNFSPTSRGDATIGAASFGENGMQPVKVIETKTVGAYEVAILSAQDSGSLERWLKSHDYSLPDGKSEIVDDYIRRGWYFVAAKIQLDGPSGFKLVAGVEKSPAQTRKAIQKKLANGELHPLLLSFDTPQCVFPLKISAIAGKPSEVSLYVFSKEPLLNQILFADACKSVDQQYAENERDRLKYAGARERSMENHRALNLTWRLAPPVRDSSGASHWSPAPRHDWTREDVLAMVREGASPPPPPSIDRTSYIPAESLLTCLHVEPNHIAKSARSIPRLRDKNWYLTKFTKTFPAAEMRDLEFEPAIPVMTDALSRPSGQTAALVLTECGTNGSAALIRACRSRDATSRINASAALENARNAQVVELLPTLLKDKNPEVRLHAARAAANNWDQRLTEPLIALFQDPIQEIRDQAVVGLSFRENHQRIPVYLAMANSPDPNVRRCALGVLLKLDRNSIPKEPIIRMLKDSSPEQQSYALHLLWQMNRDIVPREVLVPLLINQWADNIVVALRLIERNGLVHPSGLDEHKDRWLTSKEAVVLTTNRLSYARLMGLDILQRNADAKAVELAMPLLRDSNRIVRSRAFTTVKTLTGQNLSDSDPAKWEQWWTAQAATEKK